MGDARSKITCFQIENLVFVGAISILVQEVRTSDVKGSEEDQRLRITPESPRSGKTSIQL